MANDLPPSKIDKMTGTTIEERRRIRKRHKREKQDAERGIRSMYTTDAYREGFDRVFRGGKK